jgi:hypothetical protein
MFALVAGLSLAGSGVAIAQSDTGKQPRQSTSGMGEKNVESNKHLTEIDIYLRDAMDNTKALYQSTQVTPGKLDQVIQKEDVTNVDKAVSSALTHVSHVKSLPSARVADTATLDQLQADLTHARTIAGQLRREVDAGNRDRISSLSSQLFAQLRAADESFGKIADETKLTRIGRVTVPEKQPVGGSTDEGGARLPSEPSPGTQQPGY